MVEAFSYPETNHPALAMATLPIPVDEATAEAFQNAPPDKQEEITSALAEYAKDALLREERAAAVARAANTLAASAKANGWTEEMNEALLRGDFDGDE